jgi:hypothetical protein
MKRLIGSRALAEALITVGIVPPNCHDIVLEISATNAVVLRYTVYVEDVDLEKLAEAFTLTARKSERSDK